MEKIIVKEKTYHDSAFLMRLARDLEGMDGVDEAVVLMGTEMNRKLMRDAGFASDILSAATPMDMMVALKGRDGPSLEAACEALEQALLGGAGADAGEAAGFHGSGGGGAGGRRVGSLEEALQAQPGTNVVSVAVPGAYAAYVAAKALEADRHVFLFSDNVSVTDEVRLKNRGADQGLLVMGPDCGTAIISGVGLGFANRVPRGSVGLVGASGTGIQEITCGLSAAGHGVSQAVGTGSRDLKEDVGGLMTAMGLRLLQADPETQVCVVVAKGPDPSVAQEIHELAMEMTKPVVMRYLGEAAPKKEGEVVYTESLDAAVAAAGALAEAFGKSDTGGLDRDAWHQVATQALEAEKAGSRVVVDEALQAMKTKDPAGGAGSKGRLLGLFGGGSLASEAKQGLERAGLKVEVPGEALEPKAPLLRKGGAAHAIVDVGDDFYTRGRPHPMVDQEVRCALMEAAGSDAGVGVLLFDLVLGDGAHLDPAPELAEAVRGALAARERLENAPPLRFIASVSGTDADPQITQRQMELLQAAGVSVQSTAARAAALAVKWLKWLTQGETK